jgi:hypothetical protein
MTPPDTAGSAGLEVADVLERAAALIEPEGAWLQERYSNGSDILDGGGLGLFNASCWCAEGAIAKVLGVFGPSAESWADRFVAPLYDWDSGGLAFFNDAPERTQAEVVAKLREAAALSRAGKSS